MPRRGQYASVVQIPLDLDPLTSPTRESTLRAAFRRLEISRSLTFEQVMHDSAYAIGIRNLADAIARRGASGNPTRSTPITNEIAEDMDPLLSIRPEINYSGAGKGDR